LFALILDVANTCKEKDNKELVERERERERVEKFAP
jgi:hypothetical protein